MSKRWKFRPAGRPMDAGQASASRPIRRRLLMVGAVVVAGIIVYLMRGQTTENPEAALEGKVTLDGKPLAGVSVDFQAEERSEALDGGKGKRPQGGIARFYSFAKTDADGSYRVTVRPDKVYTALVRPDPAAKPYMQANGTLPVAEVHQRTRHFDIQLVSP